MIYTRDLCGMYKETYIYEMRPTKETYIVEREIYKKPVYMKWDLQKMIYTRDLCSIYKETYIYANRPTVET